MIQKFLLIGYYDQRLVTDVSLGGTRGISQEDNCFVVGIHNGTFDTYDEAYGQMKYLVTREGGEQPELGYEIKPVFVKEEKKSNGK